MRFARPEEIDLLSRLQTVGLYKEISPLTFTSEQAKDIFSYLPALEWQSVTAVDQDGLKQYHDFIGVTEYDVKTQIKRWADENDYDIEHISNPDFGGGIVWLEYFSQPVKQVNLTVLTKTLDEWELPVNVKRIPLAFNGVNKEELEHFFQQRPTKEQYAKLRYYVDSGKMPKLDKDEYMTLNQGKANELIEKYKDAPETQGKIDHKKEISISFPEFKRVNLLSSPKADYLQRLILRDLMISNTICNDHNRQELESKIDFVTSKQADTIIDKNAEQPAGPFLLHRLNGFIQAGKLINQDQIRRSQGMTVTEVMKIFHLYKEPDPLKQSIIRDLIDSGYIRGDKDELQQKVIFMPANLMNDLISKFGAARVGSRFSRYLNDMAESGAIGALDDQSLCNTTVRKGMEWVAMCRETDEFKKTITPGQINALNKFGKYINLGKVNLLSLTRQQASHLIQMAISQLQKTKIPERNAYRMER